RVPFHCQPMVMPGVARTRDRSDSPVSCGPGRLTGGGPMKTRLDVLVVEKGFFASRQQAQRAIMAGLVHVDGQRVARPGTMVADTAAVEARRTRLPYVSRGGLGRQRALDVFGGDVPGPVAVDGGGSAGGFTDCLLLRGARRVYAIDVC